MIPKFYFIDYTATFDFIPYIAIDWERGQSFSFGLILGWGNLSFVFLWGVQE
jgi:hypothetical protein